MNTSDEIMDYLTTQANPVNVAGMARFGIRPARAFGISVNQLRALGREIKREVKGHAERHSLASDLWATGVHEARILASIIDEPALVSRDQMETWAADFDSWDIVDQCCGNLFDQTPHAFEMALTWSGRDEEYIRRAGFSLMAWVAVHNKSLPDEAFEPFLQAILGQANDERNFVKKAVNWALRSIGKRNPALNARAIRVAREMESMPSRAARWNARDTLKELTSEKVIKKLNKP